MEVIRSFGALHDSDFGRKLCIERGNPIKGIHSKAIWRIKMCDLSKRVNPGIGPAGSMQADLFFGYVRESSFYALLNGVGIGLNLPPTKAGAVVSNGEFEEHK
jgi:hypothetical protein